MPPFIVQFRDWPLIGFLNQARTIWRLWQTLNEVFPIAIHSYGLFTVTADQTWIVLEQALRERFIEFYGGVVPLVDKDGAWSIFSASDFEAINEAFRRGGSHAE